MKKTDIELRSMAREIINQVISENGFIADFWGHEYFETVIFAALKAVQKRPMNTKYLFCKSGIVDCACEVLQALCPLYHINAMCIRGKLLKAIGEWTETETEQG